MTVAAEPASPRLGRQMVVAAFYAVLQRVIMRGLGLFSTLILVRLLSPDDFGVVAVASAVYVILDMLTTTNFGMAIIRMAEPQRVHYDTVFTLSIGRAVVIVAALLGLAELQAGLMDDPRVVGVTWVLASSVLIGAFESPRLIDFSRSLRFERLMRYYVLGKILGILISLPLAFWLQNYWALVLGGPISRLVTVPYSYRLAPHRPRLSVAAWREMFSFSKWLMLGNLCNLVDGQLMNFIIGRFQGVGAVGLYQVGYQIAVLPITEIAAPIRAPLYAGFARIRHDVDELRRQFLSGLEMQWLFLLPLTVGIGLTAREVTLLFLGERWAELIPLIPLIALFGLFDSFGVNTHNVFIVLDRQARLVITYAAMLVLRLAVSLYGVLEYGIAGALWGLVATSVLNAALWQAMTGPLLRLRPSDVPATLWRAILAALVMCGVVWLIPDDVGPRLGLAAWPLLAALSAKAAAGAATYAGTVLLLWLAAGRPARSAEAHLAQGLVAVLARLAGLVLLRQRSA
ncbi:lipopolysaccharide biosynthesis protein [Roseomonas sp. BN140053]|uniref:lipopolysaccharide biosynthesis protein n=1 Tax=Roseomonas sp. BN140053 TaxID=3391898 RepID=UPI0039EC30B5